MPAGRGHRAGGAPPGGRAAVRQARHPARAPAPGQAVASRHRAARQAARARAPPEGRQRGGRPARAARRGVARRQGLAQRRQGRRGRPRASAAPRRARAPTRRSSASARSDEDRRKHDPFASRVPDHSVVHRYARCLSYPEWGVGTVNGIYFTGEGDDIQQWARVSFQVGVRTVPAGSLQFVDFHKPDPGAERVQRFMTAAKHALAEGDFKLAAQRLVYARDAEPRNTAVLRLLPPRTGRPATTRPPRAPCATGSARRASRPAPHRTAARIYEDMGALSQALDEPRKECAARAADASAWERLGRLRLRGFDRAGAREALERARALGASEQGLLDLALVAHLAGDVGGEVSRVRAGDAARAGLARRRGRATRTRSRAPTASASASPPASARWRWPTTPRSATCASRCSRRRRASSTRPGGRRPRSRQAGVGHVDGGGDQHRLALVHPGARGSQAPRRSAACGRPRRRACTRTRRAPRARRPRRSRRRARAAPRGRRPRRPTRCSPRRRARSRRGRTSARRASRSKESKVGSGAIWAQTRRSPSVPSAAIVNAV